MFYNSISRLFLCLFLISQLPFGILIAQSKPIKDLPAVSVASQQVKAGTNNEPRLASQEAKKPEENSGLWSNPLVKMGAVVAFLYAGGFMVAGAIWHQIKDLFPADTAKRNDDDNDE